MLHLHHDRPEIARSARWYLEPVDYLTMRLTGRSAASHMSMTASWLTDNRRLDVLDYDPTLVRLAGVEEEKLPPLVPSGSVVGPVQPSTAAALGLGSDVQVITGMPDLHAVTIGSGLVLEGEAHASIGTSAWISCPLPRKKTDVVRQVATVPGLGTSLGAAPYLMGNSQDSAGRCLQWFRDQVAAGTDGARPGFDAITALAESSPPGANGVLFTPWLTGERSPVDDRAARGGFHNVSIGSTQGDLSRAVLEGVALNLRWLLAASERFAKGTFDPLRLVGGGAQSELWCQIVADVCDRTVERVADPLLTGLRGVGIAAGLALGEFALTDVRSLVPVDRTFAPEPAHRAAYDRAFAELPRLYRAQRGMSARLDP
jgi:xylulokinase